MSHADAELLASAANGDTSAFDQLVAAHAEALHRFAHSLGVRGADLDDVLQDAFVSAWRAAASYRGDGSVRSWLLTIVRNAVRQSQRRAHGDRAHWAPIESAETLESVADRAGWGRTDGGPAGDAKELVMRALDQLAAEDREILLLREIEELSGEETAAALHVTMPAMKSRLHRARLRLAAAVRELERDVPPTPEQSYARS
jgi:RNA polymerase sigma-70 factor (ECF subfamily)